MLVEGLGDISTLSDTDDLSCKAVLESSIIKLLEVLISTILDDVDLY